MYIFLFFVIIYIVWGCDAMKLKNVSFLLMIISFVMIFSGCVSMFIISLREDRSLVLGRMNDVYNSFEEFTTSVSLYEDQRDLLYEKYLSTLYYDTMASQDTLVKNSLSNYEAIVDNIEKQKKVLDALCNDVYYPDSRVNNKCSNYKIIFEQVNNLFVNDINYYNKNIAKYNLYAKSVNSDKFIASYETKKKYIDCNNDGRFESKEDTNGK